MANPYGTPRFDYDPVRNQLIVGQSTGNRVVLHRVGIATSIVSVTATPDPSMVGQSVMFSAIVTASPNAPNNGQVTFSASSGESCVDTTATVLSVTSTQYSCAFAFTAFGSTTVVAEYTGSATYAYSRSTAVPHNLFHPSTVFSDSFEAP